MSEQEEFNSVSIQFKKRESDRTSLLDRSSLEKVQRFSSIGKDKPSGSEPFNLEKLLEQ